jgi:hypothetical protein
MRLIDADALIQKRNHAKAYGKDMYVIGQGYVMDAPTIDAVPVARGEWEIAIGYDPNKKVQCQNCYKMAYEPTSYCPNCGAKMEDKP